MKWSKLLTNLVANATSAILDWSAEEVFRHRDLYRLEVEAGETVRDARGTPAVDLPGPAGLLGTAVFWPTDHHPILFRAAARGRGEKRRPSPTMSAAGDRRSAG
jgi:2-dehydropantoate 2-reductase